jgi:hypothetical protein
MTPIEIIKECAICKEHRLWFLTIDHINNDGAQHRKKLKSNIYKWIIKNKYPEGFQILCWDCNWEKYLINKPQAKSTTKKYINIKQKVYNYYGNKCNCCEKSNLNVLVLDHVNNDGSINRMSGCQFYYWIVRNNYPNTIQLLCRNCNNAKQLNNGVCPHKI